jgi:Peptidase of plants and bacteria
MNKTHLLLALLAARTFAAEPAFKVEVDYSAAPACEAFATKSKAIIEEWYPKLNEALFDKNHPLPRAVVHVKFEPMKGVAHATGDGLHISEDWVTKKSPNDYGMVVHELTHIVQDYKGKGEGWLTEGIADYTRHKFFEKDIEKLRINPDKDSYTRAYTIAAAFLFWLEQHKDREIVRKLNIASHDGTYSRELFKKYCGADVDALWREFADSQRAK